MTDEAIPTMTAEQRAWIDARIGEEVTVAVDGVYVSAEEIPAPEGDDRGFLVRMTIETANGERVSHDIHPPTA